MAESITRTLGWSPLSEQPQDLPWPEVSRHLRSRYLLNPDEIKRKEKASERQRLFQSGGDSSMESMLDSVLKDPDVLAKRAEWIEFAKFNNVLRRVITELSTVYAMPAKRIVSDPEQNARYQEVQRLCRMHEVMQRVNRLANLHRAVVVMPRMRAAPSGETVPVLDVITPAKFSAVRHPMDPSLCVGILFENDFSLGRVGQSVPKWTLWTAAESVMFDQAGEAMPSTQRPHSFGVIPAILFTLEPPDGQLIDSDTGDDLVAAHKSIWFLNVVHMKEAKSATVQPVLQGDLSRVARNQADDSETPLILPDGATATTLDRSMDLSMFTASARHVYETAAANYGLSSSLLYQQGVQSADARELLRVPLRELRLQQQIPFRDLERELAVLMSKVVADKRSDLAFDVDGWSIDFADPQTPLGTHEAQVVLEKDLQMGFTSEIAEMIRRNPDLDREQARAVLMLLQEDRTDRLRWMREFQSLSGGMAQGALPSDATQPADDADNTRTRNVDREVQAA